MCETPLTLQILLISMFFASWLLISLALYLFVRSGFIAFRRWAEKRRLTDHMQDLEG